MEYARTLWRGVYSMDLTKMRRWSAIRRGVLVIVVLVAVGLAIDGETGSLAAFGDN